MRVWPTSFCVRSKLYSRRGDDPHETFNLAADPEYQDVRARMREVVLRWIFETADVMPWYNDQRQPNEVDLPTPWEQYTSRLGSKL